MLNKASYCGLSDTATTNIISSKKDDDISTSDVESVVKVEQLSLDDASQEEKVTTTKNVTDS